MPSFRELADGISELISLQRQVIEQRSTVFDGGIRGGKSFSEFQQERVTRISGFKIPNRQMRSKVRNAGCGSGG